MRIYAACFDAEEIERFDTPWEAWSHLQNLKAIYPLRKNCVSSVVNIETGNGAFTYRECSLIWVPVPKSRTTVVLSRRHPLTP
jgi:hypothetical protein